MRVPPLSERAVTEEDEERFRRESQPRKRSPLDRWAEFRTEARSSRPKGAKARFRSWMNVDAFSWGMRATVVLLIVGGFYALYINGVAEGWWRAWGDNPNTVATVTPEAPPPSSEPAMSGGYEIGPDGVLVRPAEHAASTYTKPELPEEAKENTERGAELAAEYLINTLTYAWNTGDTQPFEDATDPGDDFRENHLANINSLYSKGWMYGNSVTITKIVSVSPVSSEQWQVQPNTITVVFEGDINNGISCVEQRIISNNYYSSATIAFFITWKDGKWVATGGMVDQHD